MDNIKLQITEMNKLKWEVFDEKVSKLYQIKKEKEYLDKQIEELKAKLNPYSNKLKSEKIIKNKNIPPSPDNSNSIPIKSKKKNISISTDEKINDNSNEISIFVKVQEILDKTVDNVKILAKESVVNNSPDEKRAKIDKIKKITYNAIDEINELIKYFVEQTNALIEKINGNELTEKIILNKIKKEEELKCEKCKKKYQYEILDKNIKDKNDKNHSAHWGVRCNGCGAFIWENN